MNITITIERQSAKQRFVRALYQATGYDDYRVNLRPPVEAFANAAALQAFTETYIPSVVRDWEAAEQVAEIDDTEVGVGQGRAVAYTPPVVVPEPEPTPEELAAARLDATAVDRYQKEAEGILWTDSNGDDWMFDSSLDSQSRFTSATAAINKNSRTDGGVWKCASVDELGELTLAFRPMTNQELGEVSDLLHAYVQKCFDAEAATANKIMAGDMTANFAAEFAAL